MKTNHIKVDLPERADRRLSAVVIIREFACWLGVARDFVPDSDLDVLVEFDPGAHTSAGIFWDRTRLSRIARTKGATRTRRSF